MREVWTAADYTSPTLWANSLMLDSPLSALKSNYLAILLRILKLYHFENWTLL